MPRLIEIQDLDALPPRLTVGAGDVLWFVASGGHVREGDEIVQMLGPFLPGFPGPAGEIVSPAGPPSAVFFLVRAPGNAVIDVVTGDPWRNPRTTVLRIIVGT